MRRFSSDASSDGFDVEMEMDTSENEEDDNTDSIFNDEVRSHYHISAT